VQFYFHPLAPDNHHREFLLRTRILEALFLILANGSHRAVRGTDDRGYMLAGDRIIRQSSTKVKGQNPGAHGMWKIIVRATAASPSLGR